MSRTIVAIDGPAGAGKSTTARLVAQKLSLPHVDTGATYRVVALRALERSIPLDDPHALAALASETMEQCRLGSDGVLYCNGKALGSEIRTAEVTHASSIVAAHPEVRSVLVERQRDLVGPRGAVVEGRDIGTVVWPDATLKVYLDAHPDVRAERRTAETDVASASGIPERDERDASRPVGAMQPANDATILDTSDLTPEVVADKIVSLLERSERDGAYIAARLVLTGLLKGAFRLEIEGRENVPKRGGVILAPNHRSLIDIPVAAAVTTRKVWFMAKDDLFRNRWSARILGRLGAFPVRRGHPDRKPLQRSLALLAAGEVVGIFPEGTRRPGARFEELEEGLAYVALRAGVPIVPVAISGTEAVFPPGRKLPKLVKVRVLVGEPFRLGPRLTGGVLPRARVRAATLEAQQHFAAVMHRIEPR